MGNLLDIFAPFISALLRLLYGQAVASYEDIQSYEYAMPDPTQLIKPQQRSLDYISIKYRNDPKKLDTSIYKSCDTIWKCFQKSVWTIPDRPFLGRREPFKFDEIKPSNNHHAQQVLGNYKWLTFRQVDNIVDNLTKSLIVRKLCPMIRSNVEGTPNMKFIGIFSENRQEWYLTQLAACSHSIVTVPIAVEQQFLDQTRICQLIDSTEMTTLCVSQKTLGFILDLKSKNKLPNVTSLITFDVVDPNLLELASSEGVELLGWQFLVDDGSNINEIERDEPKTNSIFYLGVTSGTTGDPKMAMLTHKNFISGQVSAQFLGYNFNQDDVYLSYVPLSHVYEQICHASALIFGFRIGYGSNNMMNLIKDIQYLKPTFIGSFPNFFNKIYEKIQERVKKLQPPLNGLVNHAIQSKMWYYHNHGLLQHWIYDPLFLSQIRNILGGRIRIMISGGAPLYPEVKHYLTTVFSAPIFEAYGTTESAGNLACTAYWDRQSGHVGGILSSLRMQVREVQDLNCDTGAIMPRGELYIKGNSVMKGYFKDPEQTKQVLDDEGWFKVGDLCVILPNGSIQVIERVKEYTKLQNGQFVAPQKLESIYLNAPMINQICIEVNSKSNHLVAIVIADQEKLEQLAQINSGDSLQKSNMETQEIEYYILKQLEHLANKNNLDLNQRIKRVHIANEPFSFKNGLLTNTQKLKRHAILSRYRGEVDKLLENSSMQNIDQGELLGSL